MNLFFKILKKADIILIVVTAIVLYSGLTAHYSVKISNGNVECSKTLENYTKTKYITIEDCITSPEYTGALNLLVENHRILKQERMDQLKKELSNEFNAGIKNSESFSQALEREPELLQEALDEAVAESIALSESYSIEDLTREVIALSSGLERIVLEDGGKVKLIHPLLEKESPLSFSLLLDESGQVKLMMSLKHSGDDWLFFEQVTLKKDNSENTFLINMANKKSIILDNGVHFEEVEFELIPNIYEFTEMVEFKHVEVTLRSSPNLGNGVKSYIITKEQKEAIATIGKLYVLMFGLDSKMNYRSI